MNLSNLKNKQSNIITKHITNNMAQQTAVKWLFEKMAQTPMTNWYQVRLQALAMEKEQIMDSHIEGQRVFDKHPHTQWTNDQAELYYNETYGTEG